MKSNLNDIKYVKRMSDIEMVRKYIFYMGIVLNKRVYKLSKYAKERMNNIFSESIRRFEKKEDNELF